MKDINLNSMSIQIFLSIKASASSGKAQSPNPHCTSYNSVSLTGLINRKKENSTHDFFPVLGAVFVHKYNRCFKH